MATKILVVDDEPDVELIFRQKFRRRVRSEELDFVFAANGKEALDKLRADPEIVLVFTDLNMPVMTGLALLREIRNLDRELLVSLVISAYDDMSNIREAMNQGAYDFITKPIDVDDLEKVLDRALGEVEKIRKRIEMARQLEAAEREKAFSEYSKRLQKEFFENITHEIRTPLTLLLAPLESALGISTDEEVRRYLSTARRNGQLLLDLVNQLLDFARIDAQKMKLQSRFFDLVPILRDMCGSFGLIAEEKGIAFDCDLPGELNLNTDDKKLSRIVLNLLSNAFKFTPPGGKVHLRLHSQGGEMLLRVKDTGPGISQEDIQRIFDRFHRAEDGSQGPGGTGIGLSFSKALAELLGGEISVESELGRGATFTVRIPLSAAGSVSAPETEEAASTDVSQPVAELPPEAEDGNGKAVVLLVEDNQEMRQYISGILSDKYQLLATVNGLEGLESARKFIPDLIVSDWMMPEMDGLELLSQVRHDRDTSHIPFVLLTAKSQVEDKIAGLETGAGVFLNKPFHPDELLAQISSLLSQRERMRERFRTEFLRPEKVEATSMEDQFISEVKQVMEKHLANEGFGVEMMADEMAMSRRTLGRKLSALTGQSPVKFIRAYRLERAMQMLRKKAAPVWEVALKTGFGSSSYFTKCFKDHYGISPREAVE